MFNIKLYKKGQEDAQNPTFGFIIRMIVILAVVILFLVLVQRALRGITP